VPPFGILDRPTPPRITEHGAPGGSDLPPQNYGTWCRESAELQRESGDIRKFSDMTARGGGTYPYRIAGQGNMGPGGGVHVYHRIFANDIYYRG
jgi:hypothetical protein